MSADAATALDDLEVSPPEASPGAPAASVPPPAVPVHMQSGPTTPSVQLAASLPAIRLRSAPPVCQQQAAPSQLAGEAAPPLQQASPPAPIITIQMVSPAGAATPRSALTTAFSLLRQSSADLAAEAAAVADAVAGMLAEQHSATLQALGLADPAAEAPPPGAAADPAPLLPSPAS